MGHSSSDLLCSWQEDKKVIFVSHLPRCLTIFAISELSRRAVHGSGAVSSGALRPAKPFMSHKCDLMAETHSQLCLVASVDEMGGGGFLERQEKGVG